MFLPVCLYIPVGLAVSNRNGLRQGVWLADSWDCDWWKARLRRGQEPGEDTSETQLAPEQPHELCCDTPTPQVPPQLLWPCCEEFPPALNLCMTVWRCGRLTRDISLDPSPADRGRERKHLPALLGPLEWIVEQGRTPPSGNSIGYGEPPKWQMSTTIL